MNQGEMFGNLNGKLIPRDITARKHGGNPESKAAFESVSESLTERQRYILDLIIAADKFGLSVDQLARAMQTTPNAISGRITELRMMGKIEKRGTRKTRSGCSAAVWIAK